MDTSFEKESRNIIVSLDTQDSLTLINGGDLSDSVEIDQAIHNVTMHPKSNREEYFKAGLPIGDVEYVRALGYKSSIVVVEPGHIDISASRTLIAANQYTAERVPNTSLRRSAAAPLIGDVIIRYAELS